MYELLFSYGTLQQEKTQQELFGRKIEGKADTLPGYTIATIEIKDEKFLATGESKYQKTLMPSTNPSDYITGTALELTLGELTKADTYEPVNYKRRQVTLGSGKKAWIYIAINE